MCAFVPVQFTDGSQPADVSPAAGQDGQVVSVQREEETFCGELGLRELGRVFICFIGNTFYLLLIEKQISPKQFCEILAHKITT